MGDMEQQEEISGPRKVLDSDRTEQEEIRSEISARETTPKTETNNNSTITNFPASVHQAISSSKVITLEECIFAKCNSYFESEQSRKEHELVCKFSDVINLDKSDEEFPTVGVYEDYNRTSFSRQDINPIEITEQIAD